MALKAGYNGIKKSLLDKLTQMSGALIIKSLGTALSLSDAGELRVRNASDSHSGVVQPDGETTFIEGGLLKAAVTTGAVKSFKYTGEGGSSTVIELPETPTDIIAIFEQGAHSGYTSFVFGFGSDSCRSTWLQPNNSLTGITLTVARNNNVITLTGGTDASQRADASNMEYMVLYAV